MVSRTKQDLRARIADRCRTILRAPLSIAAALALLPTILITSSAGQGSFKIEAAGPPRPEVLNQLRDRLEADGTRLLRTVNGIDIPLAELWWVRSLTVHPSGRAPIGGEYGQITQGELLAVLYLPAVLEDVKNHKVPAGLYTLRYVQLHPENNAHEEEEDKDRGGEHRDYVLLAHLESDRQPTAYLGLRKMLELSRKVPSRDEPAMLALLPLNPAYRTFPYALSDDKGHCAVQFKLPVRLVSGRPDQMRIAILLVNPPNVSEED